MKTTIPEPAARTAWAARLRPPAARPPGAVRRRAGPPTAAFAVLVVAALVALPGGPARAFTGEHHEDITRRALPWQPATLAEMADARDGAVNADDKRPYFDLGPLHCDNADYLAPRHAPDYPRTRDRATTELVACVGTSVARFRNALRAADGLVDADGRVRTDQTDLSARCIWDERPAPAKCAVLEQLGRGWHPLEDFYAHSNWTDRAAPGPIGTANPPGLGRTDVAPFFDIRRYSGMKDADWAREVRALVPEDLATGCYPDLDSTGVRPADCAGRVAHNRDLNKDTPASVRSKTGDNFRRATAAASAEISRQWKAFEAELRATYPDMRRGAQMVCALVHDDPAAACPPP
ncbi:hypothetical protein [Streptomyces sp. NRRL F-2664]|uniref:hypothetical protein n=1 Tax=Streptomyces sp. NRRL F-2664 TaxID=1463842 RepID=UPI0004CA7CCF|nr:hypothetical protein [Streptomyces sp. NRRL F-2664]